MARTLTCFALLALAVGCRNTGGDRDVGSAPRGYDTPRTLRGSPSPDDPTLTIDEQQRRGRGRYAVSDVERDPQEKYRGYADRYGPARP